jgi:transaldolase
MNNIQKLAQLGQSIWYDNISRGVIRRGELKKMVDEGLLGVTSNPTIFDKAISGSSDYDDQIRELVEKDPSVDAGVIIQALMVKDIQMGCDVLRPVFDRTKGGDGFVSIEVTPNKARDTKATIDEVRELWTRVNRPNLMVKIPATREGLPAIEQSIYEGRNINVTLIFSVERYREVADAYIKGLERRLKEGKSLEDVRSVASVFVSRIDTLVDDLLAKKDANGYKPLMGRAAVANTKFVYQACRQSFGTERFRALQAKGAHVQRPLWGSTGTKNPAYSDLLYVEPLIGTNTVNTVPPATYAAILDHCRPALTVESDLDGARKVLADVAAAGIDMSWVLQKLEDDGVAAFEKSFDGLYANLSRKRGEFAEARVPTT